MNILELLLKVLGFANGSAPVNKALGVLNYAALVPLAVWFWHHWDTPVSFTMNLGTFGMIAAGALLLLEFNRRT